MSIPLKAGQALQLWHDVSLAEVQGDGPDLTMRQMVVLMTIYLDQPPHTVRGLAAKLGVAKPVISRALDTLGIQKFVTRQRDPRDRRNVLVRRTLQGSLYVERLGDAIRFHARNLPN
ncbi:winged helix-turn-helix transcriptional regulator [Escherichia coli]|nr:winged helix-turn-helix transcriptional regulator [Escherichia coli]MIL09772.1 MarR family transcriptional regulator [Salmonella enterica subsp. enterica serovar Enteritidis]